MTKFAGKPVEPAEPDPGPGWLRSRVLGLPWPRPGHEAPCGRPSCPVCEDLSRELRERKIDPEPASPFGHRGE
jgi:hypothetical protein